MRTAKVVAITHRWCSCGCCVPFGTGIPGQPEAMADMAQVILDNGESVTTTATEIGSTLYFYEDMWHTYPPECPFNGCSEEYCACREGLNSAPCEEHMMHQDEGGRCLSCGHGY